MIKTPTCPVCGKPVEQPSTSGAFPFCSDRCRKVDFFRWWDGRYAVVDDLSLQLPQQDSAPAADMPHPDMLPSPEPEDGEY